MVSAACSQYAMELNLEHELVEGRENCVSVQWSETSRAMITWTSSDEDRLEFHVTIEFPDELSAEARQGFVDALGAAAASCPAWQGASLARGDYLIVEMGAGIEDAGYVGDVADAYYHAYGEVYLLESALWSLANGALEPADVSGFLAERRECS
jgi:hypothetical protein